MSSTRAFRSHPVQLIFNSEAMSNNNTSSRSSSNNFSILSDLKDHRGKEVSRSFVASFESAVIIAIFSPVAVTGNALILAAIWKKTFSRTPFHIVLTGLLFTDLCTGLIAQPVNVATILLYSVNARQAKDRPLLYVTFETIADASATYFIATTLFLLTLMSVERWLHMSRRSLITTHRGYVILLVVVLIPIPMAVFRSLQTINPGSIGSAYDATIIAIILICFLTTFIAYFNVIRIIRGHQRHVQANAAAQRFGQPAINFAKYKKSVITIFYMLALFSFSFFPFIISVGVIIHVGLNSETYVALNFSLVLLFLSSSFNPCLYIWRMTDIRNGVKQLLCSTS